MDKKKPIFAIRPGASGDISLEEEQTKNDYIAWCQKDAAPYNPTTLVYGDLLYVLLDRGFFACYDAQHRRDGVRQAAPARGQGLHVVALGLRRQDLLPERRRPVRS